MMIDAEFASCEGTHEINIKSKEDRDSDLIDRKGIIAVWKRHNREDPMIEDEVSFLDIVPPETSWDLQIMVTDHERVYCYKLDLRHQESTLSDKEPRGDVGSTDPIKIELDIDTLISSILTHDPNQKVVYKYTLDSDNTAIVIEGLKFTVVLKPMASSVSDESSNKLSIDSHQTTACMIMMMNSLHSFYKDTKRLQGQVTKWKFTATQLDDKWPKVQTQLLENFLTLYKKVKDELQTCRLELEEEKKKEKLSSNKQTIHSLTGNTHDFDGKALDYDDDDDFVQYDSDEVERLARGPPTHYPKKKDITMQTHVSDETIMVKSSTDSAKEMKDKPFLKRPCPPTMLSIKSNSRIENQPFVEGKELDRKSSNSFEGTPVVASIKSEPSTTKQPFVECIKMEIDHKRPNSFESKDNLVIESQQPKRPRIFLDMDDDEDSDSSDSEMVLL